MLQKKPFNIAVYLNKLLNPGWYIKDCRIKIFTFIEQMLLLTKIYNV